jgi:hypothetical protein
VIFFLSQKPRKPRCAERDCDAIELSYLVKEICEATQRLSAGGRASREQLERIKFDEAHAITTNAGSIRDGPYPCPRFDLDYNSQRSVWH